MSHLDPGANLHSQLVSSVEQPKAAISLNVLVGMIARSPKRPIGTDVVVVGGYIPTLLPLNDVAHSYNSRSLLLSISEKQHHLSLSPTLS